jgi:hypothetical protein
MHRGNLAKILNALRYVLHILHVKQHIDTYGRFYKLVITCFN